jgi:hypothetical protein
MNTAHTHSIDACRNKFSRLGSFGKGKGGHKGKDKSKDGKGRGKGSKGMPKGKGSRKGFKGGSVTSKGSSVLQLPAQAHGSSSAPSKSTADVTCYFCHQKSHYKSQCPKWLALRSSSTYQQTRQQVPRLGMILITSRTLFSLLIHAVSGVLTLLATGRTAHPHSTPKTSMRHPRSSCNNSKLWSPMPNLIALWTVTHHSLASSCSLVSKRMTGGIPRMALSMSKTTIGTQNIMTNHMIMISRNIKSIMGMTLNSLSRRRP